MPPTLLGWSTAGMCAELQISWSHNHFQSILSEHIQSICNKSRKLVGLLYCQFYLNADSDILRQFYLSCIRSHLEYACTVWDPYLAKEKALLEAVQKFACKVCCKNWNMDHESMLAHLNIPSLQQRRLQLKAHMMHQFVHGVSYIPEDILLLHPPSNYDTRNISYFSVPYARIIIPFSHTLRFWNSLHLL